MTELETRFTLVEGPHRLTPAIVSADEDAPFLEAAWRALGTTDPEVISHPLYVRIEDADHQIRNWTEYVEIPADLTVGEFVAFIGAEEYRLDHGGFGGDGQWFEQLASIKELLDAGLTFRACYLILKDEVSDLRKVRYRKHARLAANWRDDGGQVEVPPELLQLVKEINPWWRSQFDFRFGLDGTAGTNLLRASGYRKIRDDGSDGVWQDQSEPSNSPFFEAP